METLPDLALVASLQRQRAVPVQVRTLAEVPVRGERLPIHGLVFGCEDRSAPTLAVTGGVHGLERIGAQVVLAFLESFSNTLAWDEGLRRRMEHLRVVAIPVVNPGGYLHRTRSNPRGVDLMRNAPIESLTTSRVGLAGGHRLSPRLPWYRGPAGAPLEPEAQAYLDFLRAELFPARRALLLDCHSGFGFRDRLWYPFARSKGGFPLQAEAQALGRLLDTTYPQHAYVVEPQSVSYTTHGDLLDHVFDEHRAAHADAAHVPIFLPWTLEMGSWRWVRQRPWQAFSRLGWFNPTDERVRQRVLRQHLPLFDFLLRALENPAAWAGPAGA